MLIPTNELKGVKLDWAVSRCLILDGIITEDPNEFGKPYLSGMYLFGEAYEMPHTFDRNGKRHIGHGLGTRWQPTLNWNQAGPIIDNLNGFTIKNWMESSPNSKYEVHIHNYQVDCVASGETMMIAAMRCYVSSKLGNEVEIPDELLGEQDATT